MKLINWQVLAARVVAVAVVGSILLTAPVAQALTVHGDLSGTTVNFFGITEASSTDATPLYGSPSAFGNSLVFFPSAFTSSSSGAGGSDITEGTLTVTVTATAGNFIEKITLAEFGDFSLSGIGTSATFADLSGSLSLDDLTFGTGVYSDALSIVPSLPADLSGGAADGLFSGTATVDLFSLGLVGVTSVDLTFTNVLETASEAGTSAFIQKKVISGTTLTIQTSNGGPVVPEPSTFVIWSLLGLALAGGRCWQRRRQAA